MDISAKSATTSKPPMPVRELKSEHIRRTATDDIFDQIYDDITTLRMKPGTKVSEVEIAKQFSVSRQPVREAFIRLSNMGLLLVRPQRATVVKKISLREVADSRFVRTAIEVELARIACEKLDAEHIALFDANLEEQSRAVDDNDFPRFRELDAEFHKLFCITAGSELAYKAISESKTQVERLCALALSRPTEFEQIYRDHIKIYALLKAGKAEALVALIRTHLARLDTTIAEATASNEDFFEE